MTTNDGFEPDLDRNRIAEFERRLDSDLHSLSSMQANGEASLELAAAVIEHCYAGKDFGLTKQLVNGLHVLAPYWIRTGGHSKPDIEDLMRDLHFAGHYYLLRDYLYYSYNSPGSFTWEFGEAETTIRFKDR